MFDQNISDQSTSEQSMFDQIDEINPFSTEINDFVDIVNSVLKENVIDEQFRSLLRSFIALKECYKKKLIKKIKKVLKFADTKNNALSDYLSSEIQNEPEKIDEINLAELIEIKRIKINEIDNNELIKLWQDFLNLRKTDECGLGKKFTEIYQAAYTVDCNSWNKCQGIKTRLEKINKLSTIELLTINNEYSLIKDSMLLQISRQCALERSSKWKEMQKDFTDKYDVAENENMPVVSQDTIRDYNKYMSEKCNSMQTVLSKQELEKSKYIIRVNLNSDKNINTKYNIFLQRLATNDFATDNFEKMEYFFEYHINHNQQTHEIDYTLYFSKCKVKYCLNKIGSKKGYPLKAGAIGSNGYNFSDLTRYRIGQYTLKEEQYKDIFLSKIMNISSFVHSQYYLHLFINKEKVKRLLQSMYQINGGTDNIFIQFHDDIQEQGFNKGFAFANQKVIYFEEFIDSEKNNQRFLKTIECNLMFEINNEEQFNRIFNYSGTSFNDTGWISDWYKVEENVGILKVKEGIFRDMKNIDFTQNANFKIAEITYPKIANSITRNKEVEEAILRTLKGVKDANYTLKTIHSVQDGEYTCMDGTVIKGRNITNRIKNENDQLQGALAEFSFIGDKMVGL